MRGPLALVLALVVALPPVAAWGAAADGSDRATIVSRPDPRNDAVLTRAGDVSRSDRRSIDLRRLVVRERGRSVRFVVRLREVVREARINQIFLIDVRTEELPWGQVVVATQPLRTPPPPDGLEREITIEGGDGPDGFVTCRLRHFSLDDGATRWWVDIPRRCLPRGEVALRVYAQTIPGRDGARQFSHDTLRVRGTYDLGGRVRAAR